MYCAKCTFCAEVAPKNVPESDVYAKQVSPEQENTEPTEATTGGGREAPRRGQHPEHPRTPDTRTAPQNAAREFVPLLALPESSGPLMRGGGRQAKPPPLPQCPIDPGCNTKPRQ